MWNLAKIKKGVSKRVYPSHFSANTCEMGSWCLKEILQILHIPTQDWPNPCLFAVFSCVTLSLVLHNQEMPKLDWKKTKCTVFDESYLCSFSWVSVWARIFFNLFFFSPVDVLFFSLALFQILLWSPTINFSFLIPFPWGQIGLPVSILSPL